MSSISVVIPTLDRAGAIVTKVAWLLTQDVARVVVVDDASSDNTVEALLAIRDPRLKVVRLTVRGGPAAARNEGVRWVDTEWVAVLDDDDLHPDGFLETLRQVAQSAGAAVVGAPWLNIRPGDSIEQSVSLAPRQDTGPSRVHPGVFPTSRFVSCVWIPNNVIVRRTIFDSISFDTTFRYNFWRDETDFFVRVAKAGHLVGVTNETFSYLLERWPGGIPRAPRWRYELWVLLNNWKFLQRHAEWLTAHEEIDGRAKEQLRVARMRLKPYLLSVQARLSSNRSGTE